MEERLYKITETQIDRLERFFNYYNVHGNSVGVLEKWFNQDLQELQNDLGDLRAVYGGVKEVC